MDIDTNLGFMISPRIQLSSVQLLSHVQVLWPCPSPISRAYSNSCSFGRWWHPTISSFVIPFSSHLQSFPAWRFFSKESVLCSRWPKYWNFSFSISPSNEYSGLISFRIDWLDLLAVQGTYFTYLGVILFTSCSQSVKWIQHNLSWRNSVKVNYRIQVRWAKAYGDRLCKELRQQSWGLPITTQGQSTTTRVNCLWPTQVQGFSDGSGVKNPPAMQ